MRIPAGELIPDASGSGGGLGLLLLVLIVWAMWSDDPAKRERRDAKVISAQLSLRDEFARLVPLRFLRTPSPEDRVLIANLPGAWAEDEAVTTFDGSGAWAAQSTRTSDEGEWRVAGGLLYTREARNDNVVKWQVVFKGTERARFTCVDGCSSKRKFAASRSGGGPRPPKELPPLSARLSGYSDTATVLLWPGYTLREVIPPGRRVWSWFDQEKVVKENKDVGRNVELLYSLRPGVDTASVSICRTSVDAAAETCPGYGVW